MTNPVILSQCDRPVPLNASGFLITVLLSKVDSGGTEIFHQSGAEGKGPGPHFHPWDETFLVVEGKVILGVGEQQSVATPGSLVHVPGGSTHWFHFGKGGGAILAITSPGNAEEMFAEYDSGINWFALDREKLTAVAARHGQTIIL
jgi:quercetin dioxygenase-like cupin family protein